MGWGQLEREGVVMQNVEAAVARAHQRRKLRPIRGTRDIALHGLHLAAPFPELGRHPRARRFIDVGQDDGRTLLRKPAGGGGPDSPGSAGHKCDPSSKTVHRVATPAIWPGLSPGCFISPLANKYY